MRCTSEKKEIMVNTGSVHTCVNESSLAVPPGRQIVRTPHCNATKLHAYLSSTTTHKLDDRDVVFLQCAVSKEHSAMLLLEPLQTFLLMRQQHDDE